MKMMINLANYKCSSGLLLDAPAVILFSTRVLQDLRGREVASPWDVDCCEAEISASYLDLLSQV